MNYEYSELNTKSLFKFSKGLVSNNLIQQNNSDSILRIAWNKGDTQSLLLEGSPYQVSKNSIIPLVHNNTFEFEFPQEIIYWEFNRDFYCILDHDKEVSYAGFIFYGYHIPMVIHLDDKETLKLDSLIKTFEDEFKEADNIQGEMLRMLLKRIVILLTRIGKSQYMSNDEPGSLEYDIVREFNILEENNYKTLHLLQDYK